MFKTISEEVCSTRHLSPLPPSMVHNEQERMQDNTPAERLTKWFDEHTCECTPEEATSVNEIKAQLSDTIGKFDGTVWAECLKDQRNQGRFRQRGEKIRYYFLHPNKDGVIKPCRT